MPKKNRYTIYRTRNVSPLGEPIRKPGFLRLFLRGFIAFLFVVAMLHFSGIYQWAQFQQTPENVSAELQTALVSGEKITIPADIFILAERSGDGAYASLASSSERLIENTNMILNQASVAVEIADIQHVAATNSPRGADLVSDSDELRNLLPPLSNGRLKIVLTRGLAGINGVAFGGRDAVAVAEYTTSFDFRVLAHEVGHVLGAGHVSDKSNLMNSGGTGTTLTTEQAQSMYAAAERFLPQ